MAEDEAMGRAAATGESDSDELAEGVENGGGDRRAPQGYQHGSGAGGWSTAEVQRMVEATVAAVLSGMGQGGGKGGGKSSGREDESRVLLEERFFRNLDKFEGSVEGWNGWVFNLNTQIGGVSRKVAQLVEKVLADKEKVATKEGMEALVGKEEAAKYGGEMLRLLSSLTNF